MMAIRNIHFHICKKYFFLLRIARFAWSTDQKKNLHIPLSAILFEHPHILKMVAVVTTSSSKGDNHFLQSHSAKSLS